MKSLQLFWSPEKSNPPPPFLSPPHRFTLSAVSTKKQARGRQLAVFTPPIFCIDVSKVSSQTPYIGPQRT